MNGIGKKKVHWGHATTSSLKFMVYMCGAETSKVQKGMYLPQYRIKNILLKKLRNLGRDTITYYHSPEQGGNNLSQERNNEQDQDVNM